MKNRNVNIYVTVNLFLIKKKQTNKKIYILELF